MFIAAPKEYYRPTGTELWEADEEPQECCQTRCGGHGDVGRVVQKDPPRLSDPV